MCHTGVPGADVCVFAPTRPTIAAGLKLFEGPSQEDIKILLPPCCFLPGVFVLGVIKQGAERTTLVGVSVVRGNCEVMM